MKSVIIGVFHQKRCCSQCAIVQSGVFEHIKGL